MIRLDKALHFMAGVAAFIIVSLVAGPMLGLAHHAFYGLAASAVLGAAKEAFDYLADRREIASGQKVTHTVDPLDFVATVAGGFAAFLAAMI